MRINKELYSAYRKAAGRVTKDGCFRNTEYPNGLYCFATKQKLGKNGKIDNHPFLNEKFKRNKDGKIYIMDSICIHWYDGYYYHATLRDENNSHATVMFENINCLNSIIIESVSDFNKEFTQL